MKQQAWISILVAGMSCGMLAAADYPQVRLTNGKVSAIVAVPNGQSGFYKGTRFDWSGIITSLETNGHLYFAPFFEKFDPGIKDVDFKGTVLAGPASAVSGPVEEFAPLGYADAKTGGTFVKIGVGVLRKPEEQRYDHYEMYAIVDGGKRSVKESKNEVSLTQEVRDPASGYGYLYTKTVRLVPGQSRLELVHSLKNIGEKKIAGNVYDHNFFVIDHQPIGPDISLKFGFTPKLGGGRGRGPAPAVPVAPENRGARQRNRLRDADGQRRHGLGDDSGLRRHARRLRFPRGEPQGRRGCPHYRRPAAFAHDAVVHPHLRLPGGVHRSQHRPRPGIAVEIYVRVLLAGFVEVTECWAG